MKALLHQFRLSCRLDSAPEQKQQLPDGASHDNSVLEELATVDSRLREELPRSDAPALLHESIMRRIASANDADTAAAVPWFSRWVPVPAVGLMVIMALWAVHARQSTAINARAEAFTPATAALTAGERLPGAVPQIVVGPLSQEWGEINRDLARTAEFLLASVP